MQKLSGPLADPLWRVQNLYLIRDKDKNRVRPRFKPSQLRTVEVVKDRLLARKPVRHYDLKCRQSMITTLWMLLYLDDSIFNPNTRSAIVAQKHDTLKMIWEATRFAHASMPDALRPELGEDSANTLSFKIDGQLTGSWMKVALKVQGGTLNNLHVSEFPLCKADQIQQTIAACPPSANITLEGVAEGMNHAYDKWLAEGDGYTRLFHPWFIQPEYRNDPIPGMVRTKEEVGLAAMALKEYGIVLDDAQIQFRRDAHKNLTTLAPQEMAESPVTCFLSTGNPFFDGRKMQVLLQRAKDIPATFREYQSTERDGRQWWQLECWGDPVDGHRYVAGADVAEGLEASAGDRDYSVLGIIDVNLRQAVMRYKGRIPPDAFAKLCAEWCRKYNNAFLGVERNNHGHAVIGFLRDIHHYPRLYQETSPEMAVSLGIKKIVSEPKYGWRTDGATKVPLLSRFKLGLEGQFEETPENFTPQIAVPDSEFMREAFSIRNEAGKIRAVSGRHDDLTMAWAIAFEMFLRQRGNQLTQDKILTGERSESAKLFEDKS